MSVPSRPQDFQYCCMHNIVCNRCCNTCIQHLVFRLYMSFHSNLFMCFHSPYTPTPTPRIKLPTPRNSKCAFLPCPVLSKVLLTQVDFLVQIRKFRVLSLIFFIKGNAGEELLWQVRFISIYNCVPPTMEEMRLWLRWSKRCEIGDFEGANGDDEEDVDIDHWSYMIYDL